VGLKPVRFTQRLSVRQTGALARSADAEGVFCERKPIFDKCLSGCLLLSLYEERQVAAIWVVHLVREAARKGNSYGGAEKTNSLFGRRMGILGVAVCFLVGRRPGCTKIGVGPGRARFCGSKPISSK
jgi:hypothetical protein